MSSSLSLRLLAGLGVLMLAGPALAQQRPARLGDHGNWIAATLQEGGQKVCYAFTRATRSEPNRSDVLLTVTHRPGQRDAVVLTSGITYAQGAEVRLLIGTTELAFYTHGSRAAARDSQAAIRAMRNGREATARGPGPNGRGTATDVFSLSGFGGAHEAISKECPPAAGGRR
jgi:hypothetical protein